MNVDDLVGAWRLVAYETRAEDGAVSSPLGRDLQGLLLYTADGHVSATLMRPGRPRFASSDILGGSAEEKASAVAGYVAYAGTYERLADRVVHHLELSLFPNWIGTDQTRLVSFEDGRLVLATEPFLVAGRRQVVRLVWERAR